MQFDTEGDVAQIAELGAKAEKATIYYTADPRKPTEQSKIPLAQVDNGEFKSVKPLLDEWLTQPERRRGTATVDTLQSLIDLVNRHKDDNSALFAGTRVGASGPAILAVIDYNRDVQKLDKDGPARFGQHRLVYPFPLSDQCRAWSGKDGVAMAQGEFAEFLEENIADLVSSRQEDNAVIALFQTKAAAPAELMMLSREFRLKIESVITEARVLQSGEAEIGFTEEHKSGAPGAKGKFVVPGAFVLSFPLFVEDDPVRLVARLRYRVREGKIVWFYKLYKFADALRDRVNECAEKVGEATDLPVFFGNPEA